MASKKKKYVLTEEHRQQLRPWADKWIANAMSTEPMTEEDREICRGAVEDLYRAANMDPPPRSRIVFVPSPMVASFAGGFAAWIWHSRSLTTKDAHDAVSSDASDALREVSHKGLSNRVVTLSRQDSTALVRTYSSFHANSITEAAIRAVGWDSVGDATSGAFDGVTEGGTRKKLAAYTGTNHATILAVMQAAGTPTGGIKRIGRSGAAQTDCDLEVYWVGGDAVKPMRSMLESVRASSDGESCDEIMSSVADAVDAASSEPTEGAIGEAILDVMRDAAGANYVTHTSGRFNIAEDVNAGAETASINDIGVMTTDVVADYSHELNAATQRATGDATEETARDNISAASQVSVTTGIHSLVDTETYLDAHNATSLEGRVASYGATIFPSEQATRAATWEATDAKRPRAKNKYGENWYYVNGDMVACAKALGVGRDGLECAKRSYRMYQGGNFWSAYDSFLSFFRYVVKLPIDYSKWNPWETLSLHSSWRIVHKDFCIISDRPEVLKIDDRNRPHCEDGPFCRWRDGTELFAWHGTYVPAEWIMHKESLTPDKALTQVNTELRRAACEILGWGKILETLNARTIDTDPDPQIGELLEVDLPDAPRERFLRVRCGTGRTFVIPVPPTTQTALAANAWTYDIPTDLLKQKESRT